MQTKIQRTPPICDGEEWERLDFPYQRYFVSNKGRIFKATKGIMYIDCPGTKAIRIRVRLTYKGKRKQFFVHRLVARHFCPDWREDCEVDHIDGDWSNNDVSNLRCLTKKEHREQTTLQGLRGTNFGIVENGKLIEVVPSRKIFFNEYRVTAPSLCYRRKDHKKLKYLNLPAGCLLELQDAMKNGDSLQDAFFEYCIRLSEYGRKQE